MNQLAGETSPYLLQHADNPVDWHPWGPEALDRARREDKPVLLSIGYAACHWCHVMAHESFEDADTARLMNELFVNIKVDREERPDVDAIYMGAVQAMTGHGGWPLTVFLTPEGEPFYGGTYYPPEDRHGMPAFRRVLASVARAYHDRRDQVRESAAQLRRLYASASARTRSTGALAPAALDTALHAIMERYDAAHGGFEGAPKFPQTMVLDFVLRMWRRTGNADALRIAHDSFLAMARGGIHDQLGGGFHRYTVDAEWLVPHFEKMLYDNALLVRLGVHLWQATGDPMVRRVTEETVAWVAREMTAPDGGFHSSLDADSDGEEGRYYLWSERELREALGADADAAIAYWGVTPAGNFEGRNILHVAARTAGASGDGAPEPPPAIERARGRLRAVRDARPRPALDDKVVASWNGLMLRAVAECARVFGDSGARELALRNADFVFRELVRGDRVRRAVRGGTTKLAGYLEDYAALGLAALALYELTFDAAWLARARALGGAMQEQFWDDATGAFHDTAREHEPLITRPREVTDNATPSGTSLATELLLRLATLLDDEGMRRRASWVLETLAEPATRFPLAFGHLLGVADLAASGAVEVALVGDPAAEPHRRLAAEVARHYVPALVLAGAKPDDAADVALLRERPMIDGAATAYVCRAYACQEPTTSAERLGAQLEEAVRAR